jgi:plasmid stabilization system protein ParE
LPELIWTSRALADISRLHRFLLPKNPDAARRAIGAIRAGVSLLEAHPHAGRQARDMDTEFRELWIPFGSSGYLTLYRTEGQRVVILAVRHGRELGY